MEGLEVEGEKKNKATKANRAKTFLHRGYKFHRNPTSCIPSFRRRVENTNIHSGSLFCIALRTEFFINLHKFRGGHVDARRARGLAPRRGGGAAPVVKNAEQTKEPESY